jgi:hypothetical protein
MPFLDVRCKFTHAMPMPRCGLEKSLSEWHGHSMAWHDMCESNMAALCKSNGKDTIKTPYSTARHGREMAWVRHGNGMVCVN